MYCELVQIFKDVTVAYSVLCSILWSFWSNQTHTLLKGFNPAKVHQSQSLVCKKL